MIIKLPICNDDKIIFTNFFIEKINNPDKYIISLFDRNYHKKINKIKIPCCNNFEGISYLDLFFPLELSVIGDKLYFQHFMQKIFLSQSDLPIDFFCQLEQSIQKINKHSFIHLTDIETLDIQISTYLNTFNDTVLTNDYLDTIKKLWEVGNFYLNYSIYIIYKQQQTSIKHLQKQFNISKKIINITNVIKNIKYTIHSSNLYNYTEHHSQINNKKMNINQLKNGYTYFIKIPSQDNNKFFQIHISNISNGVVLASNNINYIFDNYEWYYYLPNLDLQLETILFHLIINKHTYEETFEKTNLKIEKIHTAKMLEYYYQNNECSLLYMKKLFLNDLDDFNILAKNNFSQAFFDYIIQKYSTNIHDIAKVYRILFNNYTYPIKQNKLESSFDFILYFSLTNLDKIIKDVVSDKIFIDNYINDIIPFKVRTLFYNLIQFFYSIIKKNNYQILYFNQKFFNDYLHRCILKNILLSQKNSNQSNCLINTLFLSIINSTQKDKIISILKNTLLCIDVANRLTWNNLPKKLGYLEIFYNNKDLTIIIDKLNKNIFNDTFDNKLKKIIHNPFEMFKYLKKEKDYIKWITFLGPANFELFYTPISLSSSELVQLAKLLFLFTNIKEQHIKEPSYIAFIDFAQKYHKLILHNNRINIKIKEHFNHVKSNINLGFLAKHMAYNHIKFEYNDKYPVYELEETIKEITKKYNKYKTKYLIIKNNDIVQQILSDTSTMKSSSLIL